MIDSALLALLPTEQRLALAYAPARSRPVVTGVLALDARLAEVVRGVREPMLAQLRLAWWRERLAPGQGDPDSGEPVLALLAPVLDAGQSLSPLVDGWEALLSAEQVDARIGEQFAAGRAAAWAAVGESLGGGGGQASSAAHNWALADLASRVQAPEARAELVALAAAQDWSHPALPRALRPLAVLHGLARRSRGARPMLDGPGALLAGARLGMFGV